MLRPTGLKGKGAGMVSTAIRIGPEVEKKIGSTDKACGWEPGRKVFPITDVLVTDHPFYLKTFHVSQRRVRREEMGAARAWIRKGIKDMILKRSMRPY